MIGFRVIVGEVGVMGEERNVGMDEFGELIELSVVKGDGLTLTPFR